MLPPDTPPVVPQATPPGLGYGIHDPGIMALAKSLIAGGPAPGMASDPATGVMAGQPAIPAAPAPMPAQGMALGGEGQYGGDDYAHLGWGTAQPYDYSQDQPLPHTVHQITAPRTGGYVPPTRVGMGDFTPPRPRPSRADLIRILHGHYGAYGRY